MLHYMGLNKLKWKHFTHFEYTRIVTVIEAVKVKHAVEIDATQGPGKVMRHTVQESH